MPGALASLDATLFRWLTSVSSPGLDFVMVGLTTIGRAGAIWIALGVAAVVLRRSRLPGLVQLLIALLLANLVGDYVLKPLVDRPRPFEVMADVRVVGHRPANAAWPSGHAAQAGAGAVAVSALWPAARGAAWALALLIALSRVYLGVHYPLDVVSGLVIGALCGYWVTGGTVWDRRWPSAD